MKPEQGHETRFCEVADIVPVSNLRVDTVRTTRAPAVLRTRTRPGLRTGVWEGMRGGAPVTPADLAQVEFFIQNILLTNS